MSIQIYTMTHKKFDVPDDKMYIPLQVGSAGKESLGYLCDNTGNHISEQNCYYSELTGVYWVWKNVADVDYVGICHYRRYLLNEQELVLTKLEIEEILTKYDVLTSKLLTLDFPYDYGFAENHNIRDLQVTGEVIKELYPEYYPMFEKLVHQNHTYFGNICVMSKKHFDAYCDWLFSIFFAVQKRIDIENYDDYHKRVFGFISEFLLYVWIQVNGLHAYECKVGLIGEKVETKEVKKRLEEYFNHKDIAGAKAYFMEYYKKRPDILMEAADVGGDLRVSMQLIATAEQEKAAYGKSILEQQMPYAERIRAFKILNGVTKRYLRGLHTAEDENALSQMQFSEIAIRVAVLLFCKDAQQMEKTIQQMLADSNASYID